MNCPFCRRYFSKKNEAVDHIEEVHFTQLPKDMNAEQYLYFSTHKTIKGICMCGCGRQTNWNYKTGKPHKLCPDPKCKDILRAKAKENHIRVYGKATLLDEPEHQKKMANNRNISGVYKFTDGGEENYMGSYELNFLKFCDKVLEFDSQMVMECPYTFEYMDGETRRFYIPDKYLPDFNLVVEIKEGGSNPNNNPGYLEGTKRKEALKDKAMENQRDYNYIKIVDNNFGPFLKILFDIKSDKLESNKKQHIVINETASSAYQQIISDKIDPLYLLIIKYRDIDAIDNIGVNYTIGVPYTLMVNDIGLANIYLNSPYFEDKSIDVYKFMGDESKLSNIHGILETSTIDSMYELLSALSVNGINITIDSFFTNNSEGKTDFLKIMSADSVKSYLKMAREFLIKEEI